MAIVRYDPLRVIGDMNRLFERMLQPGGQSELAEAETTHWFPNVDIREESDKFLIKADLPGVDSKNVHVSMDDHSLIIRGDRKEEHQEEEGSYTHYERLQGSFYRRFTLPESADPDKIDASMHQGVLTVTIPKAKEKTRTREIKVKGA